MPVAPQPSHMISVRKATSEDAAQILACLRAAFEDYRQQYTPEGFLDTVLTPETFQERLAEMIVFAAVNDSNEVVGTIACNLVGGEEGHLRGMAVLPSFRGSGIAGAIAEPRRRRAAILQMYAHYIGHDRAAPARDALLRETRLLPVREDLGFFRHAVSRVSENASTGKWFRRLSNGS